ncbi:type VI secretion system-associated protein TagF [Paraburkholderia sp. CNPSo 3272]|uniref:type VI secretion system-associated protein TagF n=1 Tax=Paraburkholderia sp. CNPSo 3272 TaxID=2940931 RepID=UPI0020B80842|nr:type VI secretion system-associated protein TagF [Paraburkholderia sp. CNPSo 3272]MCP3725608.1 type VI secretion system-associated protein TagF [Paraburkholderia sp. CNPSo 3272]
MNAVSRIDAGFYGKVRTHGDFVGRGLSVAFVGRWDAWLQRGLLAARERHAAGWLERYLQMPVWRFSAPPSVIDDCACTGALMPGIDAVGRYFPFVIARQIEGAARAVDSRWHGEACALALSTLAPSFSLKAFESNLAALREQPVALASCEGASVWWTHEDGVTHRHEGPLDARVFLDLLEAHDSVD